MKQEALEGINGRGCSNKQYSYVVVVDVVTGLSFPVLPLNQR
jgi:hypothetical protein